MEREKKRRRRRINLKKLNEILDPTNNLPTNHPKPDKPDKPTNLPTNPTDYMWKLVGETRKDVENERKTETRMFYGKYNARGVQTKFSSRGLSQNYVPQPLPRYPFLYIHIFGWKFCTPSRYVLCFYHDMIYMMY